MKSNELFICSGSVLNLLCIYIHKEWTFSIFFLPKMLCDLELSLCFSSCYMCINMYMELLINSTFVNILYLCNCCLFTQAIVEVALGSSHGDSSGSFNFALSWVFPSPF